MLKLKENIYHFTLQRFAYSDQYKQRRNVLGLIFDDQRSMVT